MAGKAGSARGVVAGRPADTTSAPMPPSALTVGAADFFLAKGSPSEDHSMNMAAALSSSNSTTAPVRTGFPVFFCLMGPSMVLP